jgi:hypothetical protein
LALSLNFRRRHLCLGPGDPRIARLVSKGGHLFVAEFAAQQDFRARSVIENDFPGQRAVVTRKELFPGFVPLVIRELGAANR